MLALHYLHRDKGFFFLFLFLGLAIGGAKVSIQTKRHYYRLIHSIFHHLHLHVSLISHIFINKSRHTICMQQQQSMHKKKEGGHTPVRIQTPHANNNSRHPFDASSYYIHQALFSFLSFFFLFRGSINNTLFNNPCSPRWAGRGIRPQTGET